MALHLLIVEDDQIIADHIFAGLLPLGHSHALAQTGAAAIRILSSHTFQAVVLDRMLPDIDGISVLRHIREGSTSVPVLMLSALGSVKNRIEGLESGADDYLTKPFSMDELAARLNALVRRNVSPADVATIAVGGMRLDSTSHCVSYRGRSEVLNRKQYSLLAYLMSHADKVATKAMLLNAIWSYSVSASANIIESNMSRLRAVLQNLGCDPIETQRGAGYILRSERCE